jgi:hypothetical protein
MQQSGLVMAKKVKKAPFDAKAFLATVDTGRTRSNYRTSELIFSQGDPADAAFFIQNGKVKLNVVSEQGKEAVVALSGPGEFFGEGCLAGQPRRMATPGLCELADQLSLQLPASLRVRVRPRSRLPRGLSRSSMRTQRSDDCVDVHRAGAAVFPSQAWQLGDPAVKHGGESTWILRLGGSISFFGSGSTVAGSLRRMNCGDSQT